MRSVPVLEGLWDEQFNGLADEFFVRIAEHHDGLRIRVRDARFLSDDHQAVRSRFEDSLEDVDFSQIVPNRQFISSTQAEFIMVSPDACPIRDLRDINQNK